MNTYEISYKNNFEVDNFKKFISNHKKAKSIKVTCKSGNADTANEIKNVISAILSEIINTDTEVAYETTTIIGGKLKYEDIIVKVIVKVED